MDEKQLPSTDLLIVGGGINGVGIARDAAGRGLKVTLCELGDLGWATSSRSSKLIHGGLRYLEHAEFRLVREALAEREVLLKNARHIIWPLRFRLPHSPQLRPAWMIRLGLFLYDHLSTRTTLLASHGIQFGTDSPLHPHITQGFEYSDGWVDDSRLVILNAMAAHQQGATILPRTRLISTHRQQHWHSILEDQITGQRYNLKARMLINAAGPWVSQLFDNAIHAPAPRTIRLVKGSHIVVPRIHQQPQAYILQNEDSRIVFVIPYEDAFSLIGTTDVDYQGDPGVVEISPEEIDYLINVSNRHFRHQLSRDDVVHSYAGVRPLIDDSASDAQKVSRDYNFEIDAPDNTAPLLSIFGGKITTYRKLAEAATNQLTPFFPALSTPWTAQAPLPGADFSSQPELQQQLSQHYPWLEPALVQRYVRSYGTLCQNFLAPCKSLKDMGKHFGAGLYEVEVHYLQQQEWALTSEDILWRRSKLGLHLARSAQQQLEQYLNPDPDIASA